MRMLGMVKRARGRSGRLLSLLLIVVAVAVVGSIIALHSRHGGGKGLSGCDKDIAVLYVDGQ